MRLFLWITGLLLIFLSQGACDRRDLLADDLAMAREAELNLDWPLAERLIERYLREEQNSEKRWEAWNMLIKAINARSPEPGATLDCLDVMREEYADEEKRLAEILSRIGKCNEQLRRYDRAARAWSAYVDLGDISSQERLEGYRHLAAMQFGQRHFEAGEESLQQCLALPVPDHDKIYCMLDLADVNMTRERWQEVADLCQQILDSDPDGNVRGVAGYLLGDALEQMGQKEAALRRFQEARDLYPNPAVMDNRIEHLKKMTGASGR